MFVISIIKSQELSTEYYTEIIQKIKELIIKNDVLKYHSHKVTLVDTTQILLCDCCLLLCKYSLPNSLTSIKNRTLYNSSQSKKNAIF